jgi:hypothetical protein
MVGIGGIPDMRKDALMCEHTPMIGSKIGKQFIFGGGNLIPHRRV